MEYTYNFDECMVQYTFFGICLLKSVVAQHLWHLIVEGIVRQLDTHGSPFLGKFVFAHCVCSTNLGRLCNGRHVIMVNGANCGLIHVRIDLRITWNDTNNVPGERVSLPPFPLATPS
jgi:hypothetical protein